MEGSKPVKVKAQGFSLTLRVPPEARDDLGLAVGDEMEWKVEYGNLIYRKVAP